MPTQYPAPTTPTYYPTKVLRTEYPLIDNDPHFKRVIRYARPLDYVYGTGVMGIGPLAFWLLDLIDGRGHRLSRETFRYGMKLATLTGVVGGFLWTYQRVSYRFYGGYENAREVEMDMREMVDKVKRGEPLYGNSRLSPHMQAVAARHSRYSALIFSYLPWFNFVNHNHHGVDTAKYYQQAERELEASRLAAMGTVSQKEE